LFQYFHAQIPGVLLCKCRRQGFTSNSPCVRKNAQSENQ